MIKRLTILLSMSFSCASALADTFSTDFCDFTVDFPAKYSTREMLSEDATGIAAIANATKDTRLAAECWPYIDQLPLDVYAQGMRIEMQQRGFEINNVSIDRETGAAPQVILSGRLSAGGEKYHTTTISLMGPRSRLDLSIVERHPASQAQTIFRNSVRRK